MKHDMYSYEWNKQATERDIPFQFCPLPSMPVIPRDFVHFNVSGKDLNANCVSW